MGPWGQEPLGASKRSGQLGAGVTIKPCPSRDGSGAGGKGGAGGAGGAGGHALGPFKVICLGLEAGWAMKSGVGRDGRSRRRGRKRSGKLAVGVMGPWRPKGWAMEVVAMNPWSHGSRDGGRPWGAKWVERAEQDWGPLKSSARV